MARAKARDIAALAGLAGLAYANRDKLFGSKEAEGPSATAAEKEASDVRTKAQIDAVSGNRPTNASSYTGTTKNNAQNIGFEGGDDSDKNLRLSPKPVVKKSDNKSNNRQKAEAENNALAAAGSKIPAVTSVPIKPKPQLAKPGTGVGASIATIANPVTQDDIEFRRLRDARMAKKIDAMKTQVGAFKGARMEDEIRQNMNSAGIKHGGAVKMASGGMTASRRGDGIASRGKTRGKIC